MLCLKQVFDMLDANITAAVHSHLLALPVKLSPPYYIMCFPQEISFYFKPFFTINTPEHTTTNSMYIQLYISANALR